MLLDHVKAVAKGDAATILVPVIHVNWTMKFLRANTDGDMIVRLKPSR